jgi:hypothetical protein
MIEERGDTLVACGDISYEHAGEFAKVCDLFIGRHRSASAIIDLSDVGELVSPCLTAIYEDARLHRPASLRIIAPARISQLFQPGEIEGLFALEVI